MGATKRGSLKTSQEAGKGGRWGGAPESSVGATKHTELPYKPNNWFDLAGDEGVRGGAGGWAREAGKGGRWGGGTREQCGSNEECTGCP